MAHRPHSFLSGRTPAVPVTLVKILDMGALFLRGRAARVPSWLRAMAGLVLEPVGCGTPALLRLQMLIWQFQNPAVRIRDYGSECRASFTPPFWLGRSPLHRGPLQAPALQASVVTTGPCAWHWEGEERAK